LSRSGIKHHLLLLFPLPFKPPLDPNFHLAVRLLGFPSGKVRERERERLGRRKLGRKEGRKERREGKGTPKALSQYT
jgi:hypothetical protein